MVDYNSLKKHSSAADRALAEDFIKRISREEFKKFYIEHTLQETASYFNIPVSALHVVRQLFEITETATHRKSEIHRRKFKYYNNGTENIIVYNDETLPEGFVLGKIKSEAEHERRKVTDKRPSQTSWRKGLIEYTNGKSHIYLAENEIPPEGYIKGNGKPKKLLYHNSKTGEVKYFYVTDEIPGGWLLGGGRPQDNTASVQARIENIHKYEKEHNCTLYKTLTRTIKNGWNYNKAFKEQLQTFIVGNRKFVPNEYLEAIQSFKPESWDSQAIAISKIEQQQSCTSVSKLIQKYGQLHLFKELPNITVGKFRFISNEYLQTIEDYVGQLDKPTSILEKQIVDYIRNIYSGEVLENTKNIIVNPDTNYGLELDIYIPEKKVAVEFNGLYFHSSACNRDKQYHFTKSKLCEDLGIRLIHIYEDEWKYNREKVCQLLKITLGCVQNKIYARNCIIKRITNSEAKPFNEQTHLQGHRNAQITYGLFYNNELVQLMSFSKSKYNKNLNTENSWEIIRGCPGSNNIVIGGVSKLFKHFIKENNPDKLFSYCDFNKFNGKSYEAIGMKFIGYTGPDKYWIINGKRVNRNPKKYKELSDKAEAILWGSGSKKYLWEKEV